MRVLPAALSPEECRGWIDRFESAGYASMAHRYPPGYRNNHRAIVDSPTLAAALAERFAGLFPLTRDGDAGARWTFAGLNPRFRTCRYQAGESFRIHRDGAQADDAQRSFFTLMLYLNDASEFAGGATHFYATKSGGRPVHTVTPAAGTAVVFPHDAWHDGELVTQGVKYVLRSDLVYRRPRSETVITGHRGYVWDLAALPGGGMVSVGRDGQVIRWGDAPTPTVTHRQRLDGAGPTAVVVLADGSIVVGDRRGRIFSVTAAADLLADLGAAVLAMRAWHDGVVVADAAGRLTALDRCGTIRTRWSAPRHRDGTRPWLWALATSGTSVWIGHGEAITRLRGSHHLEAVTTQSMPAAVRALAVDSRTRLAVALEDGSIVRVTDRETELVGRHDAAATTVAWLDDGRIVSGGEDDHVRIWDREGLVGSMRHGDFVTRVLVRPDGTVASASYDESVRRWPVAHHRGAERALHVA